MEIETLTVVPAATPENVAPPVEVTQDQPEVKTEAEKSFSQSQLDEIIQKEKAKAEAKAERRASKAYRDTLDRLIPATKPQTAETGRPTQAQYANVDDYVEAMADWKLGQLEQAQRQEREQEQQRSMVSKTEALYAQASKVDGFDRQVFDELPLTKVIAEAVIESSVSAKLMAFMSSNPDEVERIASLSPARQAAEIGRMEAQIEAAPMPKVSKAPAPISPIGGSSGGTKAVEDMTDKEFAAWRQSQIKKRGSA